ncbi:MAG: bacteriophage holin [Candidatus Nanohaloarchaea archaeon]
MAEEARLEPVSMGAAFGAIYALFMLALGLSAYTVGWGAEFVGLMSSLYAGFAATVTGSLVGAVWGAVDGFILGYLLAWTYNTVLERR